MMDTLERELGQSTAKPSEIQPILKTLTMQDAPMPSALGVKLDEIADHHGGRVPLHGRLFAQVLHYAAPLECPFPHKRGTVMAQTFEECGEECLVSDADHAEIRAHAAMVGMQNSFGQTSDDAWLAQWTQEEELISGTKVWKGSNARGELPWAKILGGAGFLLLVFIVASLSSSTGTEKTSKQRLPAVGMSIKSHLV